MESVASEDCVESILTLASTLYHQAYSNQKKARKGDCWL